MNNRFVKIGALAVIVFVIVFALLTYNRVKTDKAARTEVEQGIQKIKEIEAVQVGDVEDVMESIAAAESESEKAWHERPLKERYADAMVLGDSEAASLSAYDILQESQVAAKIGCKIENADEHIQKAIERQPSVVFMTYGKNDLGAYGSADEFASVYFDKISMLQAGIPNVRIYVVSIMPSTQTVKDEMPYMANDEPFNEALKAKAEEMNLEYINSTDLVTDEYYEPDGMHYIKELYEQWAAYMAEIAEI